MTNTLSIRQWRNEILQKTTIPAEDIWRITPDMTVIGGEVVYSRPVEAD